MLLWSEGYIYIKHRDIILYWLEIVPETSVMVNGRSKMSDIELPTGIWVWFSFQCLYSVNFGRVITWWAVSILNSSFCTSLIHCPEVSKRNSPKFCSCFFYHTVYPAVFHCSATQKCAAMNSFTHLMQSSPDDGFISVSGCENWWNKLRRNWGDRE